MKFGISVFVPLINTGGGDPVSAVVEQPPDPAGEVAFEAADGFELGFAFGVFAVEVGAGLGVGPGAGERDDVERPVELAVPAAVQPVALGVAGAGRDRGGAGVSGEAGVGGEPLRAGGVADDDRGRHRPAPGLLEQRGAVRVDQDLELGEQFAFLAGDLSDPREQPLGDPQLRAVAAAGRAGGQPRADLRVLRAPPGASWASISGAILTRCQRSRLIIRVRSADHAGRGSRVSTRISIACSSSERDREALDPVRTTASATARASIGSDFPGAATPCGPPVIAGGTRTTRSPAATSAASKRADTCRQSSIAHTRSASRPAANRSASSDPASLAGDRPLAHASGRSAASTATSV